MNTPLYLINGPLGAGKTTLLRHLLSTPEFKSARVIENEYASTSVDTTQLHDHTAEIQTIAGVCICCSTGDELTEALKSLASSSDPVIIEATGVANSLQLIEKIVVADMLDLYTIKKAIFVLDAVETTAAPEETIETYTQELRAADVVYLSKTDLVSDAAISELEAQLQTLSVNSLVRLEEGVPAEPFTASGSGILQHFAALDEAIVSHDNDTNYTVIDVSGLAVNEATLSDGWTKLRDIYGLKRMKGNFINQEGTVRHVEATPAQCRVTDYLEGAHSLVFIGASAHAITIDTLEESL